MKIFTIGNTSLALALCVASGCTTIDRSGMSLNDGKQLAKVQTKRICSDVAPVGSHMKRIECRTQEVIDFTSDRAKEALRDRSVRIMLPQESGGR